MDDIYPLEIKSSAKGKVLLELNKSARVALYFGHKVLPTVFFVLSLFTFFVYTWAVVPGFFMIVPLLLLIAGIIVIVKGYTTGMLLDSGSVILQRNRYLQIPLEIRLDLSEYKHISTRIFRGRGGGGYIYLHKSNGKKVLILRIPLLQIRKDSIRNIAELISGITKLPVQ